MKRLLLIAALLCSFPLASCNALSTAQNFENIINGVLNIAKAEEPVLSPADAAILTPWVNLGVALSAQNQACITSAGAAGSKKAAFLACFNGFAAGLLTPSELAQLRLISPDAQGKVQLYVTAFVIGINAALTSFGGTATPVPTVAAVQPTSADLHAFARQLNLSPAFGY
jgi:hypothetical protein